MSTDVSQYFTNSDSSIYALKNLPEEVVAYLFARYSRSTLSLRDDLRNMIEAEDMSALIGAAGPPQEGHEFARLQDRARTFAEKYILGYGHSSVAEHGCVHLAIEDVSIVASKLIEDSRLASYTEKSTRYVAFDPSKVYYPAEVMASPDLAEVYTGTIRALLDAYAQWTEPVVMQIKANVARTEKQTERGYDTACRASAFDILRYLLPTATYTNIGLTLNARSLETLITKLLSQPLMEGQALGERIKTEAQHIVPTLLKYAGHNAYRAKTDEAVAHLADELLTPLPLRRGGAGGEVSGVTLTSTDPQADDKLAAAILYPHAGLPMADLMARVQAMDAETKERVVEEYIKRRGRHDSPGRALERVSCTLEMTMDYGAYRDIQRHRMATQTTQPLSPTLGYETPPEIVKFGYGDQYHTLMSRAADTYQLLAEAGLVREAVYALPLATRIRVLFTWNLREVAHFIELRSARQGHPSYRRIAQQVYHAIAAAHPLVARYLRPNLNEYALTRD